MPIISRVHTLSIHIREHETFNKVLELLNKDFGLPVVYGRPWAPEMGEKRMYAAVSVGNINIEPCGPYPDIAYTDSSFMAIFFGITFSPFESSAASAAEMDRRGIAHSAPGMFMSVTDPDFPGGNIGVGFLDISENKANWTSEDSASQALKESGGGPPGILYAEEILVGFSDNENLAMWREFLAPAKEVQPYLFQIGDSYPMIRLVQDDVREVMGLVLKVSSMEAAAKYLSKMGFLGDMYSTHLETNRDKTFGLRIIMKE